MMYKVEVHRILHGERGIKSILPQSPMSLCQQNFAIASEIDFT